MGMVSSADSGAAAGGTETTAVARGGEAGAGTGGGAGSLVAGAGCCWLLFFPAVPTLYWNWIFGRLEPPLLLEFKHKNIGVHSYLTLCN